MRNATETPEIRANMAEFVKIDLRKITVRPAKWVADHLEISLTSAVILKSVVRVALDNIKNSEFLPGYPGRPR